jgi:hypothetical protein
LRQRQKKGQTEMRMDGLDSQPVGTIHDRLRLCDHREGDAAYPPMPTVNALSDQSRPWIMGISLPI